MSLSKNFQSYGPARRRHPVKGYKHHSKPFISRVSLSCHTYASSMHHIVDERFFFSHVYCT